MRIFALMVTRNEADRYLEVVLDALTPAVDELFVYDDQSWDTTPAIASRYGTCVVRPDSRPSFLEHEGRFRQAAWDTFVETIVPSEGDWVLSVDADELVVAVGHPRDALSEAAYQARGHGDRARLIPIPEVFDLRDGWPYVRVDGQWGRIQGSRFFTFRPDGRFADKAMASGSEPSYVQGAIGPLVVGFWLLHLGYARPQDRAAKHERYRRHAGHADHHVASIVQPATLQRWPGPPVPGLRRAFPETAVTTTE